MSRHGLHVVVDGCVVGFGVGLAVVGPAVVGLVVGGCVVGFGVGLAVVGFRVVGSGVVVASASTHRVCVLPWFEVLDCSF